MAERFRGQGHRGRPTKDVSAAREKAAALSHEADDTTETPTNELKGNFGPVQIDIVDGKLVVISGRLRGDRFLNQNKIKRETHLP